MPTHYWGDNWPHWDMLREAHSYISNSFNTDNRHLMCKEKYGTIRYEHTFNYPEGRKNIQNCEWDLKSDWEDLWSIVQDAAKKYPEIENELLQDMASNKEIVGKEVHDRFWTKI